MGKMVLRPGFPSVRVVLQGRCKPSAFQRTLATRARCPLQCYASQKAVVRFRLHRKVKFGESHKIVGGHKSLGDWNPSNGLALKWNDGDVWTGEVELPTGSAVEFKMVKTGSSTEWEKGDHNRSFTVPSSDKLLDIACEWGDTDSTHIIEQLASASPPAYPSSSHKQNGTVTRKEVEEESAPLESVGDRLPTQEWAGKQVVFMRSNDHSRDRQGKWDTTGLDGALLQVVKGDEKSANWLSKLKVAKQLLVDDSVDMKPDEDALAAAYVYLHWISTGSLQCVEGGGHHRPNHHAELGRQIFRSLEWTIGATDPKDIVGCRRRALVARKLQTKIPSFSESFVVSVPMTRIRDIAHRGDIPQDLKSEIKHTLQNKLHRCAGPEDLIATEAMLQRITANPGQYSQDFVNEFRIFTLELQEFFNAGGLADLLKSLQPSMDDSGLAIINTFLSAKAKVDSAGQNASFNELMEALHTLTTVRALVASGLGSGLRNDAPDNAMVMRQRWRMAEIRCEDYSFTLISRMVNLIDAKGGPATLAASHDREWALPIGAAVLGVRHMGISGWEPQECMALEHELAAWQKAGGFQERENALRLKATLERLRRMTESYSDTILDVFATRALKLGKSLDVSDAVMRVFAEAEIRASVVFQLSRLASTLLKATRITSGAAEWDALVAGKVYGKLVEVERLDPAVLESLGEEAVLLVKAADGDEELGASGANLKGVVLAHGLPHLSHLGVRARQEKVVFACCEDEGYLREKVRPLLGQYVCMAATAEGVSLMPAQKPSSSPDQKPAPAAAPKATSNGSAAAAGKNGVAGALKNGAAQVAAVERTAGGAMVAGPVNRVSQTIVFGMMDSTPSNCGTKAAACARLEQVARKAGGKFKTPRGCSIPFGVMEKLILDSGRNKQFQQLLVAAETGDTLAMASTCAQLQELVTSIRPPKQLLQKVRAYFNKDAVLMVRSSSNVEDLAGLSGAGLYESVPQVRVWDDEDLGGAIAEVWASLYTRRAVMSRRFAGLPQSEAVMGVLIQEQLAPEYCFVLHTATPLDRNPAVLYAELAVGMGETLAAGTRGSPYRLLVNKGSKEVLTLAFANFSEAIMARPPGGPGAMLQGSGRFAKELGSTGGGTAVATPPETEMGVWVVDYTRSELSMDGDKRVAVGRRLADVGVLLEKEFGAAQDVEGALVGDDLFIVQSRPQP